jgi:hypothetical protein
VQVSSSISFGDADDGCQRELQVSENWILYWSPSQT